MADEVAAIRQTVKAYLLEEFLPGESPEALTDSTPLVTGGILDSIATIKLVTFLEQKYGIAWEAHEMGAEYLNTIKDVADLVHTKSSAKS